MGKCISRSSTDQRKSVNVVFENQVANERLRYEKFISNETNYMTLKLEKNGNQPKSLLKHTNAKRCQSKVSRILLLTE